MPPTPIVGAMSGGRTSAESGFGRAAARRGALWPYHDRVPSPSAGSTASASRVVTSAAHPPLIGFGIVLGAAALFGTLGPLSRFAYDAGMEPAAFVGWRALIGLAGMGAYVAWRVRRGATRLVRWGDLAVRSRAMLLLAAVVGFTLNLCMFIAFDRITVALALLGFYTYPAMVAAANVAMGRERLDQTRGLALGLAILGMIAVVASQLDPTGGIRLDAIGIGLALGAAVSQTVFVVVSRDGYDEVPTEQAMAFVLLVTVLGAVALAVVAGSPTSLTYPLVAPNVLPLLLFTGIFAAAIPSLGFLTGIRAIGGTRAGILMLFEPVVGVALAAWLLGEALVPIQLVGATAILAAALLLHRSASGPDTGRPTIGPGGP
jgi:drug/metabolite transporter (DMT)-like permease